MKVIFFRESMEKRGEMDLILGERPNFFLSDAPAATDLANAPRPTGAPATKPEEDEHVVGMSLVPVATEDHLRLNLPADAPGMIVTRVQPNTPAASCGLEQGDIILRINRSAPKTHSEAVDAILKSREGKATLQVRRGDSTRDAVMDLR